MIKRLTLLIALLLCGFTGSSSITVTTTFTPLHTYFMAATGCSDSNAGTSAGSPWCNPDNNGHVSLVCGDVIIAAAGTYSQFAPTHTPSTCPSTSGGIDGAGGIFFAITLCGGSDLEACKITNASTTAIEVAGGVSNWAFEGFKITNSGPNARAFEVNIDNCSTAVVAHHIASINNVVFNSNQAFGLNDCGQLNGSNPPAADYLAVIGTIAQNAAQDNICLAAIDFVGTGKTDAVTTAVKGIMMGNFAYHSRDAACLTGSDVEGFMFDTLDAHASNGKWNFYNNMAWDNQRAGFQWEYKNSTTQVLSGNVFNNTFFANGAGALTTASISILGEINTQSDAVTNSQYTIALYSNIAKTHWAQAGGGTGSATPLYAHFIEHTWTLLTIGSDVGAGKQNIFKGMQTACQIFNGNSTCDAGFNIESGDQTYIGTNTFTDPLFANETDILTAKWTSTAPDCTGFENVTQCMGWDAASSTLTANTPISDLTANCASCSGKGYQKPTMTCTADANFPVWLKGIVYLHWDGANVLQRAGLVSVPCGM